MIRVLLFSFILNSGPVERKIIYDSESYLIIEKYFLNESEEVLHEKMIYYKYGNDKVFIFESGNWTEVSFEIYSKSQWKAHDFDSNVEPISFDKSGEYFFVKLSNLENTYLESLKIELLTEEYSSFPQFLFFKYEENSFFILKKTSKYKDRIILSMELTENRLAIEEEIGNFLTITNFHKER